MSSELHRSPKRTLSLNEQGLGCDFNLRTNSGQYHDTLSGW